MMVKMDVKIMMLNESTRYICHSASRLQHIMNIVNESSDNPEYIKTVTECIDEIKSNCDGMLRKINEFTMNVSEDEC